MKKLLTLSLCLLATLSLANCGGGKGDNSSSSLPEPSTSDTSSENTSSEAKPLYTHKVVGEKTETSLTVLFYVNLPNDNGLYRTQYVEPGEKIKQFSCIVTGFRGSLWFYDQFGTDPFDFDTPITEDLVLYGYPKSRKEAPVVTEIPVKEGEYKITWDTSKNCSFVPEDAGELPNSADKDEVITFKMAYAFNTKRDAVITVNGVEIQPDENEVYSVKVTEDIVIASSDVKVYSDVELYDYTLHIGNATYEMVINPSYSNEVMYEAVELKVGDTFYVEKTDGKVTETFDKRFTGNPLNPIDTYVCAEAGKYSFYFDTSAKATWIAGPITTFTFTDLPDEYLDCKIYAWNWLKYADGNWAQGTVDKTSKSVAFNLDANTYGVIILAYAADSTTAPGWEGYLVRNDSDFNLTKGTTTYSLDDIWSGGGSGGGSSTPTGEQVTYYFTDTENWGSVNYYVWGASQKAAWPGEPMTYVTTNDYGQKVYSCTFDSMYVNIIFNNGSAQTVDIPLGSYPSGTQFYLNGQEGGKFKVGTTTFEG